MATAAKIQAFCINSPVDNVRATPYLLPQKSGQDYLQGTPVYVDGSGYLAVAVASGNQIANKGLKGFASEDGRDNDSSGQYLAGPVIPNIGDLYVMNYIPSGGSTPTVITLVGTDVNFDLYTGITGQTILVANPTGFAATKPGGRVVAIYCEEYGYTSSPSALGDTDGLVVVEIVDLYAWQ